MAERGSLGYEEAVKTGCRGGWFGCKRQMTGRWGTQSKEGASWLALVKGQGPVFSICFGAEGTRKLWLARGEKWLDGDEGVRLVL